ncbi:hypothetical protein CCACVL1_21801 [Corchorus capsularis]|uniref:Uncharacterized protein n=1 Tax=Corchorus capsularis TaxID=210143 RepID=A0A1R3H206_COCAP|nr:hypothetical protein CCACVL1_21801 [Corchorus capsularis]
MACPEEPLPHVQIFGNYPSTPARLGRIAKDPRFERLPCAT